MPGQSNRNHGQRSNFRIKTDKLTDRLFQRLFVIVAGANHDLAMQFYPGAGQALNQRQNRWHLRTEQLSPQLCVRCMYRNIQRRELLLDNPLASVSVAAGFLSKSTASEIVRSLEAFGLPVNIDFKAEYFIEMQHDKKRIGKALQFVFLKEIGEPFIHKIELNELKSLAYDARNLRF